MSENMISGTTTGHIASRALQEFEVSVLTALQTYSNVHRGSGHFSQATTHLYEKSRQIVHEFLKTDSKEYVVIFMTTLRAQSFIAQLKPGTFRSVSSGELKLPFGVTAIAVLKKELSSNVTSHTGGGTAKLTSRDWVIWADAPDRYEAGTPAIINIIAFSKALQLISRNNEMFINDIGKENFSLENILYEDNYKGMKGYELLEKIRYDLIGNDITVPVNGEFRRFSNLDYSASTPVFSTVWDTWRKALHMGEHKADIIKEAKKVCASFLNLNSDKYEIIFTSNTTEAVNIIAGCFGNENEVNNVFVNSIMEHSSNDLPWRFIPETSVLRINVDEKGFFNINELESLLSQYNKEKKHGNKQIKLVALSGASNVLGTCNNFTEIRNLTRSYGALLLVDAAQLVAHRKINMVDIDADFLVFSGHKIYAPFGCGVLIARKSLLKLTDNQKALIQQSGEENYPGIAALCKSLLLMERIDLNIIAENEKKITAYAIDEMKKVKGIKIYGISDTKAPDFDHRAGVISFSVGTRVATTVARDLAMYGGIGVRAGCHCAHLIVKRLAGVKPFLENFQWLIQKAFPKITLPGIVRVSFGIGTTMQDITVLVKTIELINSRDKSVKSDSKTVKANILEFIRTAESKVFA